MRTHLGKRWLTGSWRQGLLLAACLCLGGVAGATPSHPPGDEGLERATRRFREALLRIQESFIEPVEVDRLVDAALAGMQHHLDRHTRPLSQRDLESLQSASGRSVGLGADLDWEGPYPLVRDLYEGSPAEVAGLRPADRLLTADGIDLASVGRDAAKALLKRHEGDSLAILALTPSGELLRATATFARLEEPAVEARRLGGGRLGYLLVRRFARGVSGEIGAVLSRWTLDPPEALVIDLRDCPGGFLDEGIQAADLFLPPGAPIAETSGRLENESVAYRALSSAHLSDVPVAVIVDSLTASSAELFAGALQGNGRAVLVGESTYGKRSIQRIQPMPGGGAMKITSARFATPADASGWAGRGPEAAASALGADRGPRLEPDRWLGRDVLPVPFDRLRGEGLLQRYLGEETLSLAGLSPQSAWRQTHPAPLLDRDRSAAARLAHPARAQARPGGAGQRVAPPGSLLGAPSELRTWAGGLAARLAVWGRPELGSPGALGDLSSPAATALGRVWMLDWAEERWGKAFSAQLELETDPWVRAAWSAAAGSPAPYLTAADY